MPSAIGTTLTAGTFDLRPPAWIVNAGRTLAVLLPIVVWLLPLNLDRAAQGAFAISSGIITAWIFQAYDHAIVGLIGCYLFWVLNIVDFRTAFHGFSNTTPWFLFGAMLFGMMATKSGLAKRLAFMVMRAVGHSYSRLLLGVILSDFLLTFLVPSGIARVVLMAAVALGLMEAFGLGPGSNVGRGMFIILTYTATIFDKMIIAGAASITARGLIEKFGQVDVLWSRWFIAYLPCDIITIFVAWRLVLWMYPPERAELPRGSEYLSDELKKMGPWSVLERKSALLMSAAILLWMTDFIHGISPAMIGLGVGLFATLPRLGVLEVEDVKKLSYLPIFFVAAAISMSEVLRHTKALDVLSNLLIAWIEPFMHNLFSSTFILYWTAFVYHIFLGDEVSMLSTSIPVLMNFALAHGFNPLTLGMIWTFAAGGKIFVYQSAVLVVGYSYGYFDGKDMLKIGFALTVVESLILLILVPLYWPMIGLS